MTKFSKSPLFLSDEELQKAIEMLFFAYRNFTYTADSILREYGFGRAHHRVLYFVARYPGLTHSELLEILRVSKQSLNRVLRVLLKENFVEQRSAQGDKRKKSLFLTHRGEELCIKLNDVQKHFIARAYRLGGSESVSGFMDVLHHLSVSEPRHES